MSFGKSRPLGLRTRLTLWTSLVLATSLGVGFGWVHHGLRRVLEGRNDAFLHQKAAELLASLVSQQPGGREALEEEIEREVEAYEDEGLVILVVEPKHVVATPDGEISQQLTNLALQPGTPVTLPIPDKRPRLRVLATPPNAQGLSLILAISLAGTETTLAEFDRWVAGGAFAFLVLAVAGGRLLSAQALRPVAESIAAARRLDPGDLSERLPRTDSGDELDELAATINGLLDRLAAYHSQIIRFTADASHELRSPLAAMRASVEVALQQPRTANDYREVLVSLGEQCERLTALVNGLLLLARVDANQVHVQHEPVNLSALAEEAAEMYEPLAEEREIRFRWQCGAGVTVLGDPQRLRQLVTNLIDNAIKFTPAGGSVSMSIHQIGQACELTVDDTGIGIPTEHVAHIFDRFYQADPSRSSTGTGLGLSICQWIAASHGGSIDATSTEASGSTFKVQLPLATGEPASTLAGKRFDESSPKSGL